jgi:hypothetical protein
MRKCLLELTMFTEEDTTRIPPALSGVLSPTHHFELLGCRPVVD